MSSGKFKCWGICVFVFTVSISNLSFAAGESTTYEDTNKSMSAFLNEGWAVVSLSETIGWRIATWGNSTAGVIAASPEMNGFNYSFVLSRQGKYVICFLENPKLSDATSKCRRLN
mgnify:CR=1 FL=1